MAEKVHPATGVERDETIAYQVREVIRETGAHKAEELRATYFAIGCDHETIDKLESQEEFSMHEFAKALIYELSPVIFVSPLLCCLLEPSIAAGYNVARYRSFIPSPLPQFPPFWSAFRGCLAQLVILTAVVLRVAIGSNKSSVDVSECFIAYSLIVARSMVVSLKYGFMPKTSIKAMQDGTWDHKHSLQNMLLFSWTHPDEEIIHTLTKQAQELANVDLGALFYSVEPAQSAKFLSELRARHHNDYQLSTPKDSKPTQVSVEDALLAIVASSYSTPPLKVNSVVIPCVMFCLIIVPGIVRVSYQVPVFGLTPADIFIYIGIFLGMFMGNFSTLMFCLVSASDLRRRRAVMDMLGKVIVYPGLEFDSVFRRPDGGGCISEGAERYLYIDPEIRDNCYSWLLMRRTLNMFANNFFRRCQTYIAVLVSWCIAAVIYLNVLIWFSVPHHFSSFLSLCCGITGVTVCVQIALTAAVKLQSAVPGHRLILKRCIVGINQELVQVARGQEVEVTESDKEAAQGWTDRVQRIEKQDSVPAFSKVATAAVAWKGQTDGKSLTRLKNLREMFRSIDDVIAFEEEEKDPVKIFGIVAKPELSSAVFGVVVAGLGMAAERYISSNFSDAYSNKGWFVPSGLQDTSDS
jgi:hypothetical protein